MFSLVGNLQEHTPSALLERHKVHPLTYCEPGSCLRNIVLYVIQFGFHTFIPERIFNKGTIIFSSFLDNIHYPMQRVTSSIRQQTTINSTLQKQVSQGLIKSLRTFMNTSLPPHCSLTICLNSTSHAVDLPLFSSISMKLN